MKDYSKGKIYALRSHNTDLYYIGSTINTLAKRLYKHKCDYKCYMDQNTGSQYRSSYKILEYGNCYIELIINYECKNKNELTQKEGEYIRKYKNQICNSEVSGRTRKQYYNDHKEHYKKWREDNKEHLKEYRQKTYNKEKNYLLCKEYRDKNKERLNKYRRDYYLKNKNMVMCVVCNIQINECSMKRHIKTKRHIKKIN